MGLALGIGKGYQFRRRKKPPKPSFFKKFGTPAAAYSLRDLSGSNPNVIEVRRSSDNAVQDFTASEITDGSLATWVGAGNNGFVRTWYDQTGANDATQTTVANQPLIVDAGAVVLENSLPAIDFDGVDDHLGIGTTLTSGFHIFYLHQSTRQAGFEYLLYNSADQIRLYDYLFRPFVNFINYPSGMSNDGFGARYLWEFARDDSDNMRNYRNGSQDGFSSGVPIAGVNGADFTIDSIGAVSNPIQGRIQEIILYNSDQSTNRTAIEANINDYYSIY